MSVLNSNQINQTDNNENDKEKQKLLLNTAPCQFTEGKTQTAIDYISLLDVSRCEPNSENGVHNFTIIATNNCLIDGRQWRIRLNKDNKTRIVSILSSDKKRARFRDYRQFIGDCTTVKKPDNLIDVLVVCNNNIRCNDIIEIIETFNDNRINLTNIGIVKCKFTIMFDEVDKSDNLNNACKFINISKKFSCINSIHLITATPYNNFWKKMRKLNIKNLINLKNEIGQTGKKIVCPKKLINLYRQLKEHNIIYVNSNLQSYYYIEDIYEKYIDKNKVIRLFAPPGNSIKSHELTKTLFLEKEFIVIIINSKSKDICFPEGNKISINEFNKEHFPEQSDVEIYNTLSKLHKLYPNTNMAITGYTCIERGITFQTDGFNFTDMIIPPIKKIETSAQLCGRGNGGKQYVKKHNIFIQKEHFENIENHVRFNIYLMQSNPEKISELDFREKTNKEKDMVRWEIPEVIQLNKEEFDKVSEKKNKSKYHENRVIKLLEDKKINIKDYEKSQWLKPEKGYKKNIIPLLNAIDNNNPISFLKKEHKEKNKKFYSIYFDIKNFKVIIVKYNGDINN